MARSEVLPAIFAMADAHQTFSHRDVRRVFVGDVAPHDVVADRPTDRPTDPLSRVAHYGGQRRVSRSFDLRLRSERCENTGFDDHESELWAQEEGIQR